jgi:hypothetical protein
MASKKPTMKEIIAYLREWMFDDEEWEQMLLDIKRYA